MTGRYNGTFNEATGSYKVALKDIKKGDFFRLTDTDTATVYIKEDFDRSSKTYWASKYYDVNDGRTFKGSRQVFAGFTF